LDGRISGRSGFPLVTPKREGGILHYASRLLNPCAYLLGKLFFSLMPIKKLISKQKMMKKVLIGAAPLVIFAVYLFGLRMLILFAAINLTAFITEYAFTRREGKPASMAVLVTATLFTLSLPPSIPLWMALVGCVFGVVFGKMVFGGFGRNIFNPALTGRAFIYVSFGGYMTAMWQDPFSGFPGGLTKYAVDAVTQATPGMLLKTGSTFTLSELFLGTTAGTIGGTSILLAVAGGLYLLFTKTANYRIVVSGLLGYLITQTALWHSGVQHACDPLHGMLAGSFMVGVFFYATDPVSASQTNEGRWLYGAFIGIMSSLITVFAAWPAGTMFAILLANMFAPITDHFIKEIKKARKAKATAQ
jgi:Na+-transporting NADH:ubiquinone oxidoreductase subunit B